MLFMSSQKQIIHKSACPMKCNSLLCRTSVCPESKLLNQSHLLLFLVTAGRWLLTTMCGWCRFRLLDTGTCPTVCFLVGILHHLSDSDTAKSTLCLSCQARRSAAAVMALALTACCPVTFNTCCDERQMPSGNSWLPTLSYSCSPHLHRHMYSDVACFPAS